VSLSTKRFERVTAAIGFLATTVNSLSGTYPKKV